MYTVISFVISNKIFLSLSAIAIVLCVFWYLFFQKKLSFQKAMIILVIWYSLALFEIILSSQFMWWETIFQWRPFDFISQIPVAIDKNIIYLQLILQILLFVPMGFFVKFFIKNISQIYLIILSIFIPLFTEFAQYIAGIIYKAGRIVDVDDVIFGMAGFWLGVGVYVILKKILKLQNK